MNPEVLAFLVLAAATIAGCIVTLWSRYVVHSAFGLMLALLGVAGFYVLLGSDFMAVTQVVVYVGGVVVLYLFGVMLTPPDLEERSIRRIILGGAFGAAVLAVLLGAVYDMPGRWYGVAGETQPARPAGVVREVGSAFLDKEGYLLPFEIAAVLLLVALIGAVFIARREAEGDS